MEKHPARVFKSVLVNVRDFLKTTQLMTYYNKINIQSAETKSNIRHPQFVCVIFEVSKPVPNRQRQIS